MNVKKVLVTGGAGYIGSHTAVELLQAGCDVFIIDNLSNSRQEVISNIEKITGKKVSFHEFDLCDLEKSQKFFKSNRPDAVIHFAALKAVGDSVASPLTYYRNNLLSLMNLLACCHTFSVQHFVFSSSCTVYGQPDRLPVNEDAPVKQAESPYGNTKKISEDILRDVTHATNLHAIALRYFNPVGAHSSALIGEYPLGRPNNLMPVITQCAIGKIKQFEVFGNDYSTPDGSCIRDYLHVVDLAKAHVVACSRLFEKKNRQAFEIFNIGTGTGISVLEMVRAFEDGTGIKLNYKIAPRRSGDVEKVFADTSKANRELGWKAELGLKEMIRSAWQWEQALASQHINTQQK